LVNKSTATRNDPFNRKSISQALKAWNNAQWLGEQLLARLTIVKSKRLIAGYSDTSTGRGLALRDILNQAIEMLKPNDGEPDPRQERWRAYLILKERYIDGRRPSYLSDWLGIARSTYDHAQMAALDALVNVLQEWEQNHVIGQPGIPLTAPPRPPHKLIGRDHLLPFIKQKLFACQGRKVLVLVGLPGVGKTALALELANDGEVANYFPDGVLWARMGPEANVMTILGIWAAALNISRSQTARMTSLEERVEAIRAVIGMRRMLLVIDDAWDVKAALTLKLGGPNCFHLLTTRLPEMAAHFAGKEVIQVNELNEDDGLTLLTQLLPEVAESEPVMARELVRAVGDLPLALIFIANYLRGSDT
jgi:hypothetical protein